MKAEEFRIGNLAIDFFAKSNGFEDYIVVISSLSDIGEIRARRFNKNKGQASILREMLVGIPLTDEWLVNFGFDKNDHYAYYSKIVKSGEFALDENFVLCDIQLNVKLEYVHQLQNLYFTLTGEELTLIEKP